jgi:hypothetical protein
VWRAQCTCPGSADAKGSRKSPIPTDIDFRQIHRRSKDKRQSKEDIDRVVFEAVGHADRAAVRSRLLEELALRDVAVPPPPFVELRVDTIMARSDVAARGRLAVEGWTAVAATGLRAARNLYDVTQTTRRDPASAAPKRLPDLDDLPEDVATGAGSGPRTRYVRSDRTRWVEINVEPDRIRALATAPTAGGFNLRGVSGVLIVLWRVSGTSGPVRVDRKADPRIPIGMLQDEDGAAFDDVLTEAERDGVELISIGVRWQDPGGSWHVYLFLPGAPAARSQV